MQTSLVKTSHQLPQITSKLSLDEDYFYKLDKVYTIKQYVELKLKETNSGLEGEQLARYHIGNALQSMYEMIGLPKKDYPSPELAKRISRYIQKTFPYLAPVEIVDAVEFALQEKFPIKRRDGTTLLDHFRIMDLKFISEFLQSYVKWRYDKRIKLEEKINAGLPPAYQDIVSGMIKDDQSVKTMVLKAFEAFKENQDDTRLIDVLRQETFEFLFQIGIVKYDSNELNEKFRNIMARDKNATSAYAKGLVRTYAIKKNFESLLNEDDPFKIFDSVSYLSWYHLKMYHPDKKIDW